MGNTLIDGSSSNSITTAHHSGTISYIKKNEKKHLGYLIFFTGM